MSEVWDNEEFLPMNGNQWALLESYSIDYGLGGRPMLNFSGLAPATPEILRVMQKWMHRPDPKFPIYQEEWMCLYCGSPNELPERHCTQCGAPRNWFIG